MLSALSTLVNVIAPVMATQGSLLGANAVFQTGFHNAAFDAFYTLAGPWIAAAGPIESALSEVMYKVVAVLSALAG